MKFEITKCHSVEDKYLFIDVFPFDNLPASNRELVRIYKKAKFLKRLTCYKNIDLNYLKRRTNSKIKKYIELLGYYLIAKNISMKYILKKEQKIINKYGDETNYIGCIVWGYGPGERIQKDDLKKLIMEFEDCKFSGIVGYDKYLTGLYGDYMKPPSNDKIYYHELEIREREI